MGISFLLSLVMGESIGFLRCLFCEDNLSFYFYLPAKEYFWVLKVLNFQGVGPEKGA